MICLMGVKDAGVLIGTHDGDYAKLRRVRVVQKDADTGVIKLTRPLEDTVPDSAEMCLNPVNVLYTVDIDSYAPVFALYMAAV